MEKRRKNMNRRGSLTFGILLILVGGWFLAAQFIPSLEDWVSRYFDWPFWVIGPGLLLLVAAIVSGVSGLAVPGSIVSGVGLILYYQNYSGDWQSWAYMWSLVVGFAGVGVFIMHLLDGNLKKAFTDGGNTILTSAVLFLIFGSFFRAVFRDPPFLGDYWPVLLIVFGLWMLIRPFIRRSKPDEVVAMQMDEIDEIEEIEENIEEI
jgi:hypothetical protein